MDTCREKEKRRELGLTLWSRVIWGREGATEEKGVEPRGGLQQLDVVRHSATERQVT